MSGSVTVIGGVSSHKLTGLVSVPVSGLSSSSQSALQGVLSGLSTAIEGGLAGMTNNDLIAGAVFSSTISGTNNLLELTNTDSTGGTTSGSTSGVAFGVSSIYSAVVVQVPGTITVNGSTTSADYLTGASSNVELNTQNGTTNTVVAAGGNDTLNLRGNNNVGITGGDNRVRTFAGSNTVLASGNASVIAGTPSGYAGKLELINQSTAAATVFGGAGSATVFGGLGGGTFVGGTSGHNLLTGGVGSVELVGGGNGDTLSAGANSIGGASPTSTGTNYLFAGSGNETLLASSVTGTNLFAAGNGSDVISSQGKGTQYFFGGSGSATMSGSTVSGSSNVYFFGTPTATGGNDVITNFNVAKGNTLFALDGANITSITSSSLSGTPGALVTLSDGTHITLLNVSAASISGSQGGTVIT